MFKNKNNNNHCYAHAYTHTSKNNMLKFLGFDNANSPILYIILPILHKALYTTPQIQSPN